MKVAPCTLILMLVLLSSSQVLGLRFNFNVAKIVNKLGQKTRGMVSTDWQQSAEHEDGIKYAHDEVTCKLSSFICLLDSFFLCLCMLNVMLSLRSNQIRRSATYSSSGKIFYSRLVTQFMDNTYVTLITSY